jgi:hypothetical protein
MLFRTNDGKVIIVNKNDFKNDKLYFKRLMEIHSDFDNAFINQMKQSNYSQSFVNELLK